MLILNHLPLTKMRVKGAKYIYRFLYCFLRNNNYLIKRGNINFEVDISEGIDLALFLFGNFQKYVTDSKYLSLSEDAVIVDVGANCGIMTLHFAQSATRGHVFAFEPTDYAFKKLQRNLSLNPELSSRVTAVQSFVSSTTSSSPQLIAYSSWKVDGLDHDEKHPLHCGTAKSCNGIPAISLDDYFISLNIERIDLMKIDTDGHELDVLRGAESVIKKYLPGIIFEVGLYILDERGESFNNFCEFFTGLGYDMINIKNRRNITAKNWKHEIPLKSTIDILAFPSKSRIA